MRFSRAQVILALLFVCCRVGAELMPAAARGVRYLVSSQRVDGLWSATAVAEDGLAAIIALWGLTESSPAAARLLGQSALLLQDGLPADELPGALTVYICGGCVSPSLLQPFAGQGGGGWCMAQGARADVLSTVLVSEALLMAPELDLPALTVARDYLLAQRSADGHWRLCSQAAPGDLRLTARVAGLLARVDALTPARSDDGAAAELHRDLAALLVATGGQLVASVDASGATASALVDMAWVLRALCHLGCWDDAQALKRSLVSAQHADGSWGDGDSSRVLRTTCVVVGALRCFTISSAVWEPDLAVPVSSMRLQAPVGDAGWGLSVTVFNDGRAESLPCSWELHSGLPGESTLLAQGHVPALIPRGSCKIQAEFALAAEPSVLYVLIDPDGESGDGCRNNNVARLEYRPVPEVKSWSLWLSPLTIRSEGVPEMLLLRPGCGAMISALLVADGLPLAKNLRVVLLDNGREHLSDDIALGGDGAGEYRGEWFPEEGWHDLALRVIEGDDIVAERKARAEVSYDEMVLRILPGAAGESEGVPQFGAAEYVNVRRYAAETGAVVELWVANEHDERLDTPLVSASQDGRYTWHTGVQPPGRYRVYAQMAGGTGVVAVDFAIVASCELHELSVLQPEITAHIGVGDTLTTPVVVSWAQVCNSTQRLQLSWTWSDPDGVELAAMDAAHEIDCVPGALTQQVAMPEPAALPFPQAGKYVFTAVVTDGETMLTAERTARAIALPSLSVEQAVQPESLSWEACEVAVSTTVKLHAGAGGVGGLRIPEHEPLSPLVDAPGGEIDIVLKGICDDDGQIIVKGALAARVLYGRCGLATSVADDMAGCLFDILDGVCHISYSPGGSALSVGMSAPVIIALFDPQADQAAGCIEVHVEGGDETNP
ncbi:MAG: terpene cyclase/mutase family protein [Lentisphaeria bacterium]|nr:terpene cyclase/mutase family protein [Lentisphaeria bacterium]